MPKASRLKAIRRLIKRTEAASKERVRVCCESRSDILKKRLREWGKCRAMPKSAFQKQTLFPHRVEELTHRELARKRCNVQCPVTSCKSVYHNEWFRCSVNETEKVLNGWRLLMDEHSLYDRTTRHFRQDWMAVVETAASRESGLTASKLLSIGEVDVLLDKINSIRLN